MRPLIIYHGHCTDGFTSAWVAWKYFKGEADFHEGIYGKPPPEVKGRPVYLVDFTYPYEDMKSMYDCAESFLCIDHHVTGKEKLKDLPKYFSLNHSGARLTWDYFFPASPCPKLVDYVEDRDMWWGKLLDSDAVTAAIRSYTPTFENWDMLASKLEILQSRVTLIVEGYAILRYIGIQVQLAIERVSRATIDGYNVPIVNSSTLFSEVAGELAKGEHFGVCYFRRDDGLFQYSLRSDSDGVDVSEIAKQFGGGGHKHSAGFQLDYILGTK